MVCWLNVVPLACGDAAQVPVHAGASAAAFAPLVVSPRAGCQRLAATMASAVAVAAMMSFRVLMTFS
ncbi:hypothetical protein ABZS66_11720 [Dactylosporangium sp. NPDC005572]|uniref:hypothetical protein n=1 Tax=Dactylosporangium sp. NPDC005572 TaxID=3156889 RepID=UPI0033A94FFA